MTTAGDASGLWAITPLDGRYAAKLDGLGRLAGEGGLIDYRMRVEAHWLVHLAETPGVKDDVALPDAVKRAALAIAQGEGSAFAAEVKGIEQTTNHDVKAVEYFLQRHFKSKGAADKSLAFIHFACTSEDVNNLAYALMLKDLRDKRLLPLMTDLVRDLAAKAESYAALPMLSRTHGQTASPTTLGKEIAVFGHRLDRQRRRFAAQTIEGKINGAVGNYNAHLSAYPQVDWPAVAQRFVEQKLGLTFNPLTTQIENHDSYVEYMQHLRHFNTIALGLARDMWGYISLGYFSLKVKAGEVGSSTMPHKVNPIDFENAEGNFGLANALLAHFGDKLPVSRWQRDLSDSTVLRSTGAAVGHSELAWRSLLTGLSKVEARAERLEEDLADAWEVLAEPVQTVMRRFGIVDAYERLKAATRGKAVTKEVIDAVIQAATELPEAVRRDLRALTPQAYVGNARDLALAFAKGARE
jgi:adenylosuccinate lyase